MEVKELKKYLTKEEESMLYNKIEDYAKKNNLSFEEKLQLLNRHVPISETYAEQFRIFDGEEALKEIEAENIELIKKQEWIYGIQSR